MFKRFRNNMKYIKYFEHGKLSYDSYEKVLINYWGDLKFKSDYINLQEVSKSIPLKISRVSGESIAKDLYNITVFLDKRNNKVSWADYNVQVGRDIIDIFFYKTTDEYYIVRIKFDTYKCDQIYGFKKLLKDLEII